MNDIFETIDRWTAQDKAVAIATVTQTWGSAPRGVGSIMAISQDGEMVGSVSGGCVEGAVADAGKEVLQTKAPQYLHFGVADETAWDVGLSCGGSIDIFVRPLNKYIFDIWKLACKGERKLVLAMVVQGPDELIANEVIFLDEGEILGSLGSGFSEQALAIAAEALTVGNSRLVEIPSSSENPDPTTLFLAVITPAPTLIIVGGVHIAVSLVSFAKVLGYRTIVIDPRQAFANQVRFEHADLVHPSWPTEALGKIKITESTVIAVLTHDPKIDDPALMIALQSSACYVGALGSRKTQNQRRERLIAAGLDAVQVDRLHAPIGLDLGGRSPEQIALAIMAEIVQAGNL